MTRTQSISIATKITNKNMNKLNNLKREECLLSKTIPQNGKKKGV